MANLKFEREPELLGQTVVVIGGSAGIGLETARRTRVEGAKLILTGRNPERHPRNLQGSLKPLQTKRSLTAAAPVKSMKEPVEQRPSERYPAANRERC